MRHKLSEDRKKKNLHVTIDKDLLELYNTYLQENNITNKSKLIERELRLVLNDPIRLKELLDLGILPDDNSLL